MCEGADSGGCGDPLPGVGVVFVAGVWLDLYYGGDWSGGWRRGRCCDYSWIPIGLTTHDHR